MRLLALGLLATGMFSFHTVTAGTGIAGAASKPATFTLNNAVGKNAVAFVSEAPVEKINGTADGVSGMFTINAANIEATTGTLDVKVASMKTANSKRDDHMYSEMWLDEARFPTIQFAVQSIKDVKVSTADGRSTITGTAVGTFTCHGVSKPLSAPITLTYMPESAETKKRANGTLVMVSTSFEVALKDFEVQGKAGVVGKSVGEIIKVQASLFANS